MSVPRWRQIAFLASTTFVVLVYAQTIQDVVVLTQTAPNAVNGVLVSGQNGGAPVSFKSFQKKATSIPIDNMAPAPGASNEVEAFSFRRPMVYAPASWSSHPNTEAVTFSPEMAIPVTVWVIKGPFSNGQHRALQLHNAAMHIWANERMGVTFSSFDVQDATAFNQFLNFDCSMRSAMEMAIHPIAGRINVFLVNTVDGGAGNGQACGVGGTLGSVMAVIGRSAPADLLAHEMGHNFALTDLYPATVGFDATNVMWKYSSTRQYFTEGQIYRAHMTQGSAINLVYNLRPGQITRLCTATAISAICPPLTKRIWADGAAFPAN